MSKKEQKNKKKSSNYFKDNIHDIVNSIGVIIAIAISIYSYKQNEKIAIKSGAYDKGELSFLFGGYPIIPKMKYDVYYGINFKNEEINLTTLPISIINNGQKTVEEANIFYRYPNQMQIAISDSLINVESIFTEKTERKFQRDGNYDNVLISIGKINPNILVNAGDLILLNGETKSKFSFPVKTKDNVEITANPEITFAFPIEIALTAKDIETTNYIFSLNVRDQTNLDLLTQEIITEKLKEKKKNKGTSSAFFITIPNIKKSDKMINILNSSSSNTLLIQFDTDFKNYIIYDSNGEIKNVFKVNE